MQPSTYFSRLKNVLQHKIQRSIIGQGGFQGPLEVLAGQGKHLFGNSRLFHSIPFTAISDMHVLVRPGTVFAARSDLQSVNQRRNISVVGAVSRAFSIPSVSGPSFQVCGYHADRLFSNPGDSSIVPLGYSLQKKSMTASGSRAVLRNFCVDNTNSKSRDLSTSMNNGCSYNSTRKYECSVKISMILRKGEQPNNNMIYGDLIYDITRRMHNSNPYSETGFKGFHSSSSSCFSAGSAPDMSFDSSVREVGLANSAVTSEQKIPVDRNLKLLSGSCYLPHPEKEESGGEDAHFICLDEQAIGVADGVGGWADLGVDAGIYSRELMSNSVSAVHEEPKGSIDPARVLEKAHSRTKAKGSSTACIIALTDQGLQAINLGDSGFTVVRDGCTIFRSPVQQHDFNFPYQLESGSDGDLPSSGQVFTIPVAPGDVIIAGTDGLFDNLFQNEVIGVVVHAVRAGLGPQVAAQKIAALARERALDKKRQTPFSTAAQDAGFRYYGGKLDDTTVVVSYITSSGNNNNSSLSACIFR